VSHRARKRFGQNFLVDAQVIERCIASIAPAAGDLIIEIGPGKQALTRPLAESGAELVLVEIDRDLAGSLAGELPLCRVLEGDALAVDFAALAGVRPYRLVGNLPYNISTPLLFHVLDQSPAPVDMHFMLQKEVVQRLAAAPGGRDYGRLTVMCANRCEVVPLFEVGAASFEPRPRVDSAFVRLLPRPAPLVAPALTDAFAAIVSLAFSMRRKTLRNALRRLLDAAAIEAAGVDPGLRPEQIGVEDFGKLATALAGHSQYDDG